MPIASSEMLIPQDSLPTVRVALEPAQSVQHSLSLLARAEESSGFDEWVYRTHTAMTPDERDMNQLVMVGFYYATQPRAGYASFPAYLEHLATVSPIYVRNKVLDAYLRWTPGEKPTYDEILADVNSFLAFLKRGFSDHFIPEIERRAYTYLIDPPALQQLVVGHLRAMWYKYLAVEWERVRPMLQKAVRAFDGVDLSRMDRATAAEYVVGRPLVNKEGSWCTDLEETQQLIFVPSAHIGPYTAKMKGDHQTWILFGARQPQDAGEAAPELTRAELLVRLGALALSLIHI